MSQGVQDEGFRCTVATVRGLRVAAPESYKQSLQKSLLGPARFWPNKTLSLFTCCSQIFWQSCINTKKFAVLLCQAVHACVLCVYVMCTRSHVCSIPVLICESVRCMYILARIKLPNSCTVWPSTCCLVLNLLKLSYRGRKILAQSRGTGSSQTGGLLGHKGSKEEVILARKHYWHGWVIWIWKRKLT